MISQNPHAVKKKLHEKSAFKTAFSRSKFKIQAVSKQKVYKIIFLHFLVFCQIKGIVNIIYGILLNSLKKYAIFVYFYKRKTVVFSRRSKMVNFNYLSNVVPYHPLNLVRSFFIVQFAQFSTVFFYNYTNSTKQR